MTGQPQCTTAATITSSVGAYPITCTAASLAVLRLHVWVRTGTLTVSQATTTISLKFSDSDRLLRVQRYAHRFGHLSRRLRQLLLRPVLPNGRFRLLRCRRRPEHRPGQLLRERHLFGRRQFHGLVIERRIHRTGDRRRHRLAPQGLDLEVDPPRRQAVLVVPTRRAARIRSRWPLWSRRRKRTRTMCPSPNKPRPSWKTRCTSGIASLAFCRSKPRRTPAAGSTQGDGTSGAVGSNGSLQAATSADGPNRHPATGGSAATSGGASANRVDTSLVVSKSGSFVPALILALVLGFCLLTAVEVRRRTRRAGGATGNEGPITNGD